MVVGEALFALGCDVSAENTNPQQERAEVEAHRSSMHYTIRLSASTSGSVVMVRPPVVVLASGLEGGRGRSPKLRGSLTGPTCSQTRRRSMPRLDALAAAADAWCSSTRARAAPGSVVLHRVELSPCASSVHLSR